MLTSYGYIGGLAHIVAAVEPAHQFALLGDHKHRGRDTVHGHNVALGGDSQARYNVDISENGNENEFKTNKI